MNVVDRCTTCHQGITQSSLADKSVPQPFRAHPPIPHNMREWGCTICHRGQGPATEVAEAHESTLAWEQPVLPTHFIQDRKSTRLNSSHLGISYAVFCLKKKKKTQ